MAIDIRSSPIVIKWREGVNKVAKRSRALVQHAFLQYGRNECRLGYVQCDRFPNTF